MKHFLLPVLLFLSLDAGAQIRNIRIDASGDPNEPHIAIDPNNPGRMVAGANLDNVYTSSDSGNTWQEQRLISTYGVWGDPIILADKAGSFYYFHLSNASGSPFSGPFTPGWIDRMVCQRMDGFSSVWSSGSFAGLDTPKKQDKPSVAYDAAADRIYLGWTQFERYGSSNPGDSSLILMSVSSDRGTTWSAPARVCTKGGDCIDDDGTVEGGVPCVGPGGEVYMAWAAIDGIKFKKSTDSGKSWPVQETLVDDIPGGWAYDIPGISRCNGLPFMFCDLGNGPHRGNIYINWSDQRNGVNNTDVWLSRSRDGGLSWEPAVRVNTDTGTAHQFLSSMTVDQSTGYIYVLFYDRRNEVLINETEVYMAVSKDGGATFSNVKVSETPFRPIASVFFGDYTAIAATNGVVRPVWTRMDGGRTSIWTAIVTGDAALGMSPAVSANRFDPVYPNPFSAFAQLPVSLAKASVLQFCVTDLFGRTVAVAADRKMYPAGRHTLRFDARDYGMAPGTYFIHLTAGGEHMVQKLVYEGNR